MLKSYSSAILLMLLLAAATACNSDEPTDADVPAQTEPEAVPPETAYCDALGFSYEEFQHETGGFLFGDLAEDFRVNELDGASWTLSQNWTGCDSYIFFSYFTFSDDNKRAYMDDLWTASFRDIIQASASNVHYFFVSGEVENIDRTIRMQNLESRLQQELQEMFPNSPDEQAHWESHIHFVTDKLTLLGGSAGGFVNDFINYVRTSTPVDLGDRGVAYAPYPLSFAIGRDQRWDPTGSLSEYVGGPDNLKMIAFNSAFYNHRAELRAKLKAQTATTVIPLVDEMVTARVFNKDVTFPDAAAMSELDTMELDVSITCPSRNPFACSEWDRIARISLCTQYDAADPESCTENTEIVRWITPYWRRGQRHWVMDASAFLALATSGGAQRFRIEMGPGWERGTERFATMSVRLSNQNAGHKSRSVERAFSGGNFNAEYNNGREPFVFTPPTSASRVEIVSIISGHGQSENNNCAEWCNHEHTFTVNNSEASTHQVSYVDIGNPTGCAARANEGVPPGQWGNWSQSRAGWCPGLPVETVRFDITAEVTLGSENTLKYSAGFAGGLPQGGDISMNTYVVWYEQ